MNRLSEDFKHLPSVDKLLNLPEVVLLISSYGKEVILFAIRNTLNQYRQEINKGSSSPSLKDIILQITFFTDTFRQKSLKKVFNASGIIIHTNLGRAPFGTSLLNDTFHLLQSYNNLEFNLKTGKRGSRNDHLTELLKFLTGAEDVLVVNNNAAAVMLILRAFAKKKEVIVSRGELIEIGGSFRIPEIMKASECKMIEVGTTNKTKPTDFLNAITPKTAILFKAHQSNYIIKGFTQEVDLAALTEIGKQHNIPVLYDIGSGLLKKFNHKLFKNEPNVKESIEKGVDLVCFSGDKILGGPQAGIIAGKKVYIDKLKKEPMLRALRVCKTTLALLETTCMYYLNEKDLLEKNLIFKIFNKKEHELKNTAELLKNKLTENGISTEIVPSKGQFGGGTLPDGEIESFTVMIKHETNNKERSSYAEKMYLGLLSHKKPVLAILKKGNIYFDVLTIFDDEIPELAQIIFEVNHQISKK